MTAPALTAEDVRRSELKALARSWHELPTEVRQMRLEDLAHPSLRGWDLEEAWDTLQGDLALLDGLNCEIWAVECHWADVDENLAGPDRTEAARDVMEQRVGGVLDRLINGLARKGQKAGA
jgi:hypothetical protein